MTLMQSLSILTLLLFGACGSRTPTQAQEPETTSPAPSEPSESGRCVNGTGDSSKWPAVRDEIWQAKKPLMTDMPKLPARRPELESAALECEAGQPEGCVSVAAYWWPIEQATAEALYRRAADLDYAQLPKAPRGTTAPVADAHAALEVFQSQWFAEVRPAQTGHQRELIDELVPCMRGTLHYVVGKIERQAAFRRVHLVESQFEETLVLHGSLANLKGERPVWEIYYGGGLPTRPPFGGFSGFVDPQSGALVLAVAIPEG